MSAPLLLLLSLTAWAGQLVDGVACVVDGEVITFSEVYDEAGDYIGKRCGTLVPGQSTPCADQAEREVVDSLIMKVLVKQKLDEVSMDVDEPQLDRTIDQIMGDNGIETREQFRGALAAQGYTWDAYRGQLRDQIRMMRFRDTFLMPQVRVSDDEVRDAYQRAARDYASEAKLAISYVVYPVPADATEASALNLRAALFETVAGVQEGKSSFDALGVVEGVTPQKAASTYAPSELTDAFKPLLELKQGQVGGPYTIGNSFFVVRMDGRTEGQTLPFDQVADRVREQLMEQRVEEEADQWYQHARRNAAVRCSYGE